MMQPTSLMKIQVLTKAMRVPSNGRVSRIGGGSSEKYVVEQVFVEQLVERTD